MTEKANESEKQDTEQRASAQTSKRATLAAQPVRAESSESEALPTPRVDREEYVTGPNDVGFRVVNPALARTLERELAEAKIELAEWEGIEGRCSIGHAAKFTYELNGRIGCVACEKDAAESRLSAAVLAEREACAETCDLLGNSEDDLNRKRAEGAWSCASMIRSRSGFSEQSITIRARTGVPNDC